MRRRTVSGGDLDQVLETLAAAAPAPAPAETPAPAPPPAARRPDEFDFELPRGYVDDEGRTHRTGTMRLATARDELRPQIDLRVKENPAYLSVVLLSQVITRLGTITDVHAGVVERMYATDVAFLQDFYRRINEAEHVTIPAQCPACNHEFEVELVPQGG